MENSYRLDRTSFKMLSFEDADREMQDSDKTSLEERMRYFNYLMSIAYRFFGENWPSMDRTFFEMRKHSNG
jgi:hypothetical protein